MSRSIVNFGASAALVLVILTVGCSAQQTEEEALRSLRQITSAGKLPPEDLVANIESRFAGKRTGALARLLRARIKFENKDFAGAATLLKTDIFKTKTGLADHALWLRIKALQSAGNDSEALAAADELVRSYPDSVRARSARLSWAESALRAGRAVDAPGFLVSLSEKNDPDALLLTAKAYEAQGSTTEAVKYFRRCYFLAAGSDAAKEAEAKLTAMGQSLEPMSAEEQLARADRLLKTNNYGDASAAYDALTSRFPASMTTEVLLRRLTAQASARKMSDAQATLNAIPLSAPEKEEGYRQLALGYSRAKQWPQLRSTVGEMRQRFPAGKLVPQTLIDAGFAARDGRNRTDEGYYFQTAVAGYPTAVEVADAQFELAWMQHENGNFAISSQMLIDHLARYVDKDTSNRGKAGYWAARDSEKTGKIDEACILYDATNYRYGANWYGYLALGRLTVLKGQGKCGSLTTNDPVIGKAVENLKVVTVAAETSTEKELARAAKSEELSTIGLFDWAIDELKEAKKTADNSPKINLALARHYRLKGDNVNALLALAKSYPDYAQMFPEEMSREEWEIFYPLTNWSEIKYWAGERKLDPYQVAGLIRQESVFNPTARSGANAYGLMQLLVPTARTMARKYVSKTSMVTSDALYQPPLNIELGTAYMRDQIDKFGRIEYVAVAYNAGPGRVPQWRATLPAEIDEFVEAIPFKETKGYVQGVIRNSAQYRRLYDESGNFRPNVGSRPLRSIIDSTSKDQFTAEYPEITLDASGGE